MFVRKTVTSTMSFQLAPASSSTSPHIFKHGATLRFDVVTDNVAVGIERHAGNFLTATLAWPDAGKEQKVANSFGVRKCTDGFRCARALE